MKMLSLAFVSFSILTIPMIANSTPLFSDRPPQQGQTIYAAPLTFRPGQFGEERQGVSLALVPHAEPYHLNGRIFVKLWFRVPNLNSYYAARSGLKYLVIDPRGASLPVSQPLSVRANTIDNDRNREILNGETAFDDLSSLYHFTVPGVYTVTASVLLGDKNITVSSAPVRITIE